MSDGKARENWERYTYARDNGHVDFLQKDYKCRNYFYGNQWNPATEAKLKGVGRPVLTINKVFSTLNTISGEQITSKSDVSFQNTEAGREETAAALDKLWIHIAKNNQLSFLEEDVFDSGAICSRGYFDIRPSFKKNLLGEVKMSYKKSRNVILDPDADTYDSDEWSEVFTTGWMSPLQIGLKYGKEHGDELEARKGSNFMYGYDSIDGLMTTFGGAQVPVGHENAFLPDTNIRRYVRVLERQYKERASKEHFVDTATGDMRIIPSTWDRERIQQVMQQYNLEVITRPTDVIRWMTSADDINLFESVSPLKHFTIVPYFPFFHEGHTMGMIEQLISPQDLLNKSASQELHIVNSTANSGWKVKSGSLQNMEIEDVEERGAETGIVFELADINDLEKIQPNQIPTGLDRIGFKADNWLKEISGVSDSKRGFDRADVAAKAIQAKQAAGSINLIKAFQNLVRTRHMVARNTLDIIQEFMPEERTFRILGGGLVQQPEQVTVNQPQEDGSILNDLTIGTYEIVVTDVPTRDNFKDSQFDEAMRMREQGIPIPDHVLVEHSHLNRKAEIAQEMKGDSSQEAQQLAQMELELKALEVEEKKAVIMKAKADAALILARAQTEATKDESGDGGANEAEVARAEQSRETLKQQEEIALEREKAAEDIRLRREQMEEEIKLKRFDLEEKYRLKREELKRNIAIKRLEVQKSERETAKESSDAK